MITEIDLREELAGGGEPLDRILEAAAAIVPGDSLSLLVPFEPVPLYGVLEREGFTYSSEHLPSGDWRVLFTREG